jgi:XTP/dITP diphosphohydrolase
VIELLVATTNQGKFAEVEACLAKLPLKILPLHLLKSWPIVVEDGASFEENALKKAKTLAEYSGLLTVADDSGLEVDALNGAPGIYSSRYSGEEGNDSENNKKLLNELGGVVEEKRTARFVCVLALCDPRSPGLKYRTVRESCEGRIALTPKGRNGFGYDPVFFYPPFGRTFGEIDREAKASVSHRGKALRRLVEILPALADPSLSP